MNDVVDLSGAEILCSIPASDPRKPSYYHSFGKFAAIFAFLDLLICLSASLFYENCLASIQGWKCEPVLFM